MSGRDRDNHGLGELREHWRGFARESPLAAARVGSKANEVESFYASGVADVTTILDLVGPQVARGRALDLGCGPGRLLAPLAAEFVRVDGVDIAPEMLDLARARSLPANVQVTPVAGASLDMFEDSTFDLVLALLVFQHLPDDDIVSANLSEIRRVLKQDGRAFVQFDSRPASRRTRMLQMLPDVLLPRIRRRYMRRYRRSPEHIDALLEGAGLLEIRDQGRGSADHHIVLMRRERPLT